MKSAVVRRVIYTHSKLKLQGSTYCDITMNLNIHTLMENTCQACKNPVIHQLQLKIGTGTVNSFGGRESV